ncbi:MAG: cation transporter [Thermodesulfobacteriota bacterium]
METIKIQGMSCKHCVMAVQKALSALNGVTDVSVDLDKGEASFTRDAGTPVSLLHETIRKEGYEIG